MAFNAEITQFIGLPYDFKSSPRIGFEGKTVNCQSTVHLLYKARLGIELPKGMWSKEIFEDEGLIFETVRSPIDRLYEADIFVFGQKEEIDPKKFHLTYYSGQRNVQGDPLVVHANVYDLGVSVWPLSKFYQHKRYEELKTIKRVKADLFKSHIAPLINGSY